MENNIESVSKMLKLLGDKTRLTILKTVSGQERCVCEFVELLEMSQPSISQHLRKLRDFGLVKEKKRGKWVFYSLNEEHALYPLLADILDQVPDQTHLLEKLAGKNLVCE